MLSSMHRDSPDFAILSRVVLFCCLFNIFLTASSLAATTEAPYFTDISKESGLDFHHFNGMSGKYYFPEMTGQGGGFIDIDNDGDLDVYLLQGCMMGPGETIDDAIFPPHHQELTDRLYRNDTYTDNNGQVVIQFTDITKNSGIPAGGYGMGLAVGDFNNDGLSDIYVTNYGPNTMLFNNGDGTFSDVTKKSNTGDNLWSTSAAAVDVDHDGWLDLYVANYVYFDVGINKKCYAPNSRRDYCGPSAFPSQRDRLFRNRGDGTFEDATQALLRNYTPGSGLGVISLDVNSDGWIDLYVANDGQPNQLWVNQQGLGLVEDGLFSGAAVNQNGQAEASMGIAAGDIDNDGDADLIMTHIMGESNTLYINDGQGFFEDRTIAFGLAASSMAYTSFGINWLDYDNDGWLDLLIASGAVLEIEHLALKGDPYPLHLPNQLWKNSNGRKLIDVSRSAGPDLMVSEVSRGSAVGDVDNDGDLDIIITNNNGPVRLLRNNIGNRNGWLGVRPVDSINSRDMLGTKAILHHRDGTTLTRQSRTEGSYCSTQDSRILFGLGHNTDVVKVELIWPDATREVWTSPLVGQYTTLKKGTVK